jgi:hypothetical protein
MAIMMRMSFIKPVGNQPAPNPLSSHFHPFAVQCNNLYVSSKCSRSQPSVQNILNLCLSINLPFESLSHRENSLNRPKVSKTKLKQQNAIETSKEPAFAALPSQ